MCAVEAGLEIQDCPQLHVSLRQGWAPQMLLQNFKLNEQKKLLEAYFFLFDYKGEGKILQLRNING